ncbi:MAG: hypothetical protein R2854_27245 [Caldilineaceae bacterium]
MPAVVEPLDNVGKPLYRPDAVEKVTGRTLYTDDYLFDGMLHGATLRSRHPHARIAGIDTTRFLAARASRPSSPTKTCRAIRATVSWRTTGRSLPAANTRPATSVIPCAGGGRDRGAGPGRAGPDRG